MSDPAPYNWEELVRLFGYMYHSRTRGIVLQREFRGCGGRVAAAPADAASGATASRPPSLVRKRARPRDLV